MKKEMFSNFYMLPRKLEQLPEYKKLDLKSKNLLVHLCFKVNYCRKVIKDRNNNSDIVVEQYELMTSRDSLTNALNSQLPKKDRYSESQTRRCLSNLESTGLISRKSTKGYTIVKLLLQRLLLGHSKKNNQDTDQQITSDLSTTKEKKEINKLQVQGNSLFNELPNSTFTEQRAFIDTERFEICGTGMDLNEKFVFKVFCAYVKKSYPEHRLTTISLKKNLPANLDYTQDMVKAGEYYEKFYDSFLKIAYFLTVKKLSIHFFQDVIEKSIKDDEYMFIYIVLEDFIRKLGVSAEEIADMERVTENILGCKIKI